MIEHLGRQGLARIAKYNGNILPTTVFLEDDGIKNYPIERLYEDGVEIFGNFLKFPSIEEVAENQLNKKYFIYGDIVVIPGLYTLLKRPHELLKRIIEVRMEIGFKKIIFAPHLALPNTIPIFHYLGIDILDTNLGRINNTEILEYAHMENVVKKFIELNELRVLVESIPDPLSKTLLRLSDSKYYEIFEKFYPVTGKFLNSSHFESIFRPDIQRWRNRIIERYRKPEHEKYLLLLPCSAVKPYSKSSSHKYFISLLRSSGKHLHEVIVTSPLGLVPRELEFTYPAAHYDIPVTGYWYGEEKEFILKMLENYLKNNIYEKIIAYLPDDLSFLSEFLEEIGAIKIFGNLRENTNKEKLLEELKNLDNVKDSINEKIKSIARFQFGIDFPMENKKFSKKYDEIIIYNENEIYMHFLPNQGKIVLGKEAANYLKLNKKYTVEIDNFIPKGSIFVRGIKNASIEIREGDEVVIVSNDNLIGTGTATMSYYDMISQEHGEAVKVRKLFNV
ncbi:MAG: DUF5591 domain-containing protein [Thermoplasmata archaeon]